MYIFFFFVSMLYIFMLNIFYEYFLINQRHQWGLGLPMIFKVTKTVGNIKLIAILISNMYLLLVLTRNYVFLCLYILIYNKPMRIK